ncbi:hypothetical protein BJY52DRAFT_1228427 [Lactarius psammicola]|nr:hypothetical protein BJY52DRAFT_1228427 [Lactarius psammicola]
MKVKQALSCCGLSQPGAHGIILPSTRPPSAALMWTHVTHESIGLGFQEVFGAYFPKPRIRDFVKSINQVLLMLVLIKVQILPKVGNFRDKLELLETLKVELMAKIRRDLSVDGTILSIVEDFNLFAGMIIAALNAGVADNKGDLEPTGLMTSSWFRLASGVLSAILRGTLWSRGQKIHSRVALTDDDTDLWVMADGLIKPVTQGGRVTAMANQIAEFYSHYATNQEPPLADFYHQTLRVGQNHIEKVVRLKAAATYQASVNDVEGLTKMILDDMAWQLYNKLSRQESTLNNIRNKVMVTLECVIEEEAMGWRKLYMDELTKACFKDKEEHDPTPLTVSLIKESIACTVMDPLLGGDEITWACEHIQLEHTKGIEAAWQETCAVISLEKTVWSIVYRDFNKLEFLKKVAAELSYILVPKDDTKECEGCTVKCQAAPDGKWSCSGSRAEDTTPNSISVTLENRLRKLDNSTTPKARKTKGKRPLVIPKPLCTLTKAVSNITIPTDVRPSQNPSAPLRDPHRYPSEPTMNVSVYADPWDTPANQTRPKPIGETISRIVTLDSTCGVASSMHNPTNAMVDDPPQPPTQPVNKLTKEGVLALPSLTSIPLLSGIAEMLNALQNNLVTSFTSQINGLSKRINN